jgi:tRNA nucleotidyltransferase (CCA-adding enzyme)
MDFKKVLKNLNFAPGGKELDYLREETKKFIELMNKTLKSRKIKAEVFVGGSFAKNTLVKSDDYDIDIFIRFDKKYKDISSELEQILKLTKVKYVKWHGSRDYFRINKTNSITFEVIPVIKVKKVSEAENVTDLSYFHVTYVKKKLKIGQENEVRLAKQFCKATGVYGAESYINGFSGYALECLIIYYKSFEKMLKELSETKDKKIIDIEKYYKKANILREINESKISGPIVLIDPTWKERNVLAALSKDTFDKFLKAAKEFLKKPSEEFFSVKRINANELEKFANEKNAEFLHVSLETQKQEGDIAGTKMRKFSRFLKQELGKYFEILKEEFFYNGKKTADFYLILKSKREIVKQGPWLAMKEECHIFNERNKNIFKKNNRLWARIKVDFSAKDLLHKIDRKVMNSMGISGMRVI